MADRESLTSLDSNSTCNKVERLYRIRPSLNSKHSVRAPQVKPESETRGVRPSSERASLDRVYTRNKRQLKSFGLFGAVKMAQPDYGDFNTAGEALDDLLGGPDQNDAPLSSASTAVGNPLHAVAGSHKNGGLGGEVTREHSDGTRKGPDVDLTLPKASRSDTQGTSAIPDKSSQARDTALVKSTSPKNKGTYHANMVGEDHTVEVPNDETTLGASPEDCIAARHTPNNGEQKTKGPAAQEPAPESIKAPVKGRPGRKKGVARKRMNVPETRRLTRLQERKEKAREEEAREAHRLAHRRTTRSMASVAGAVDKKTTASCADRRKGVRRRKTNHNRTRAPPASKSIEQCHTEHSSEMSKWTGKESTVRVEVVIPDNETDVEKYEKYEE